MANLRQDKKLKGTKLKAQIIPIVISKCIYYSFWNAIGIISQLSAQGLAKRLLPL